MYFCVKGQTVAAVNVGYVREATTPVIETGIYGANESAESTSVKEAIDCLENSLDKEEGAESLHGHVFAPDDVTGAEKEEALEKGNHVSERSAVRNENEANSDLINFDSESNKSAEEGQGTTEDEDEPNPDYDVKAVRFNTEVLDTDENKLTPLKDKEEVEGTEDENDANSNMNDTTDGDMHDTDDDNVQDENENAGEQTDPPYANLQLDSTKPGALKKSQYEDIKLDRESADSFKTKAYEDLKLHNPGAEDLDRDTKQLEVSVPDTHEDEVDNDVIQTPADAEASVEEIKQPTEDFNEKEQNDFYFAEEVSTHF